MPLCNLDQIIRDEDVITEHFTTSQVICSCSGILLSANFSYDAPPPLAFALYDGISQAGKLLLAGLARLSYHNPFILDKPIFFTKGLYLYMYPGITGTIQYIPDY